MKNVKQPVIEEPVKRRPFGPPPETWQGMCVRAAQYGLFFLLAMTVIPATMVVMMQLVILIEDGVALTTDMLYQASVTACVASLVLSALRLDGKWWSPCLFGGVAVISLILLAVSVHMSGGLTTYGLEALPGVVVGAQAVLHGVWSIFGEN